MKKLKKIKNIKKIINIRSKIIDNDVIYEKDENENENLVKFVFNNFVSFLKNNISNPLLYTNVIGA